MRREPYSCMDCGALTRNAGGWCDACIEDAYVLDIEQARDDSLGGDAA